VRFIPSPGFLGEVMTIYLAQELTEGVATPMEDERIEKRWFTGREIDAMIANGEIFDAKTMIGYLYWRKYSNSRSSARRR
jgi:ADP-ribose pyrophosphatase